MFRGSFTLTLDEKGRLALPARYREFLLSDCQGHLVCTVDIHDPCLLLYPLAEWEEIEEKLKAQTAKIQTSTVLLNNLKNIPGLVTKKPTKAISTVNRFGMKSPSKIRSNRGNAGNR